MKKLNVPQIIAVIGAIILILIAVLTNKTGNKIEEELPVVISNSIFYQYKGTVIHGTKKVPLPEVDIKTFIVLSHLIAKDANHVYVEDRIQPGLDAASFASYNYERPYRMYVDFFSDKNGIYYYTKDGTFKPSPFDPRKAEAIGNYLKTENGIYETGYDTLTKLEGVDAATFRVLGTCYSVEMSHGSYMVDKNHVYVGDKILEGADPNTFVLVGTITSTQDEEIPYALTFWKDKNYVYAHCGKLIAEADVNTFEYTGGKMAQDKNNFYSLSTGGDYSVTKKN
jgi:hypothetical protein